MCRAPPGARKCGPGRRAPTRNTYYLGKAGRVDSPSMSRQSRPLLSRARRQRGQGEILLCSRGDDRYRHPFLSVTCAWCCASDRTGTWQSGSLLPPFARATMPGAGAQFLRPGPRTPGGADRGIRQPPVCRASEHCRGLGWAVGQASFWTSSPCASLVAAHRGAPLDQLAKSRGSSSMTRTTARSSSTRSFDVGELAEVRPPRPMRPPRETSPTASAPVRRQPA